MSWTPIIVSSTVSARESMFPNETAVACVPWTAPVAPELEPVTVSEWDGNSQYFNIQISPLDSDNSTGELTVDYQSNRAIPRFYGNGTMGMHLYASNGQHTLKFNCQGRSSTIKVLFKVTSDWSS